MPITVKLFGVFCTREEEALSFLVPLSDTWKYRSKAECCFENFPFVFGECMHGAHDQSVIVAYPFPCSLPPALSDKWYVRTLPGSGKECVKECTIGDDSCRGRATLDKVLYDTFDECCGNHLQGMANSQC